MAFPILWLGAAAAATIAGIKYSQQIPVKRGYVQSLPGDSDILVQPENGAIVCCGIYNILDHTGIWCDDRIIELNGKGLIRAVSAEKFLAERSGKKIFIACNEYYTPVVTDATNTRAEALLYQYREYKLLENNCHSFVWDMIRGDNQQLNDGKVITRFSELNENLKNLHKCKISWHLLKCSVNKQQRETGPG